MYVHYNICQLEFKLKLFISKSTEYYRYISNIPLPLGPPPPCCIKPNLLSTSPPPHSAPDVDAVILVQQWWVCGTQN